jgi:hypothetical protein
MMNNEYNSEHIKQRINQQEEEEIVLKLYERTHSWHPSSILNLKWI